MLSLGFRTGDSDQRFEVQGGGLGFKGWVQGLLMTTERPPAPLGHSGTDGHGWTAVSESCSPPECQQEPLTPFTDHTKTG